MSTISLYRMIAPKVDAAALRNVAKDLRLGDTLAKSDDALAIHDDSRVLVRAGSCAKFAGMLLYVNHHASLGTVHEKPIEPERAGKWMSGFLERHNLSFGKINDERARLEVTPYSRYTDAVVFDGRERKRVHARTDAGVRVTLNGIAVSGPRTRIRAVFGNDELPLMAHVAVWERLEHHAEVELVRGHDVLAALEKSLKGRTECAAAFHVRNVNLAYAAAEEFQGRPDLLAPFYFVEIESPSRESKPGTAPDQGPRQLMKIPAWRFPTPIEQAYPTPKSA
jgi:hypothetical protein